MTIASMASTDERRRDVRGHLHRGVDLYRQRPDKDWPLTDCISFVIMQERGIADALTGDLHFRQAGFRPLLLPA